MSTEEVVQEKEDIGNYFYRNLPTEEDDMTLEELYRTKEKESDTLENTTEEESKTDEEVDIPEEESKTDEEDNELNFEIEEKVKEKVIDEFLVPEKFKDVEEELEFYRKKFPELKDTKINPEILAKEYEETLLKQEKDFEELKALRDIIKGEPDSYVKIRFKDQLAKNGYDYRLTDEESRNIIHQKLSETFGNNYTNYYDPDDALNSGTTSNKMYLMQERLLEEINKHNERVMPQEQATINPEESIKFIEESLEKANINEANRKRFIEDVKTKGKDLLNDPVQFYKALYMDKIIEKKIKEAKEQGRKEALAEFKKA